MVVVVYDDRGFDQSHIREELGSDISYGKLIIQGTPLSEYVKSIVQRSVGQDMTWIVLRNQENVCELVNLLQQIGDNLQFIYLRSRFGVITEQFLTLKKVEYINTPYFISDGTSVIGFMFNGKSCLAEVEAFLLSETGDFNLLKVDNESTILSRETIDLFDVFNLKAYVTGGFNARQFNHVEGDSYEVVKSSRNKKKILSEYMYYQLIPERMKRWFVAPYGYEEGEEWASYRLERMHVTDLSIKHIHSTLSKDEFQSMLDVFFRFYSERPQKIVTKDEFDACRDDLFEQKLYARYEELRSMNLLCKIDSLLCSTTDFDSLGDIIEYYLEVKKNLENQFSISPIKVIGHGDPCFSNVLYHSSTRFFKFIDPKGALCEEDLWTHPYYDIAKLSHSICGNYDFINRGLYALCLDDSMHMQLQIKGNNPVYAQLYKGRLKRAGYEYALVRVYEASLFLSMLPLHSESLHKVMAFIYNAIGILEEVKQYAK